jgi:hypothetical protein
MECDQCFFRDSQVFNHQFLRGNFTSERVFFRTRTGLVKFKRESVRKLFLKRLFPKI